MIPLSPAAEAELDTLLVHYAALGRDRAIVRLVSLLQAACTRFAAGRGLVLTAPRPYPALAELGLRWLKEGPYWIAFRQVETGAVVAGIFHEASDIPSRLQDRSQSRDA